VGCGDWESNGVIEKHEIDDFNFCIFVDFAGSVGMIGDGSAVGGRGLRLGDLY
jgi:hypothetical protein